MARPLVEGLRNPTVAKEERIRALVLFDLTPFDEAAREALAKSSVSQRHATFKSGMPGKRARIQPRREPRPRHVSSDREPLLAWPELLSSTL